MSRKPDPKLNRIEAQQVAERSTPRTPVIYETVRRHGEEEMARPAVSLWWSGVAAGLSISFSLLAEALLRLHLPEASWRGLVTSLGYPVGFLIVVLGRQQLFTENTITAVLPAMAQPSRRNFRRLGRLWGIVFVANMVGTLVAAMVWLLPSAGESVQFHVVGLMTYLIGLGGFAHIVAGSVEAFLLLAHGEMGIGALLGGFTLPVLAGNIVGGTALFAVISYAQVMQEIE